MKSKPKTIIEFLAESSLTQEQIEKESVQILITSAVRDAMSDGYECEDINVNHNIECEDGREVARVEVHVKQEIVEGLVRSGVIKEGEGKRGLH